MVRYFFRRLLLALPTLVLVSFAAFGLRHCAPHSTDSLAYAEDLYSRETHPAATGTAFRKFVAKEGVDRPVFYFTIAPLSYPDTLHAVFPFDRRDILLSLTRHTGHWALAHRYEQAVWEAIVRVRQLPDSAAAKAGLSAGLMYLRFRRTPEDASGALAQITPLMDAYRGDTILSSSFSALRRATESLTTDARLWRNLVPVIRWNGIHNQYHQWAGRFIRGDMGRSRKTSRLVWEEIYPALLPTLAVNGLALLFSFLIAVPMGVWLSRRTGRFALSGLLLLYAMPAFWLGTLLMLFFATPGAGLYWIKGVDLPSWNRQQYSLAMWMLYNADKFILPIATLTLHALAIIAMQMRSGMKGTLLLDYIRTARAKGLPDSLVYWRHAFRNALFPVIALLAGLVPAMFAGSLVVEYLFNFPGMGTLTYNAFHNNDMPVLTAVVMLSGIVTIAGLLLADIMYAAADPRVKFRN